MNKLFSITIFLLYIILPVLCWAGGSKETEAKPISQIQQQPVQPIQPAQPPTSKYWIGDGGKGKILSIRKPRPTGLAANENIIPTLVQVELHNNFSNYTAISTSTEESRNELFAEVTSGQYDDNSKAAFDYGHYADPDYIIEGTITRTLNGFALHINVIKTADTSTVGSFSEVVTVAELNDLRAVRRASLLLMQKMGVTPTELTKTELARAALSNEVAALNAVAKSDTATGFEKMLYTYQASQLDPTLAEAARRVAAYQTEIYQAPRITLAMPDIRIPEIKAPEFKAPEIKMAATGNIGADARKRQEQYDAQKEVSRLRQESGNKAVKDLQDAFLAQFRIQSEAVKKQQADLLKQRDTLLGQQKTLLARQREMIAQLRETENSYDTFFTEHPPFEIIYDPEVTPVGNQDLVKGTINMGSNIATVGTQAMGVIPLMLADFEKGLETITQGLRDINAELYKIQTLLAQAEESGRNALAQLVNDYATQMAKVEAAENNYAAQLANLDAELKTTGYAQLGRDYAVRTDARYAEGLARQYAVQPSGYNAAKDITTGDTWNLTKWNKDSSRTFIIEVRLENDTGKTIGTATVILTNLISAAAYTQPMSASAFYVFQGVPVRDITDNLKVSIRRVNGRDVTVAANAGYIKISPLEDGWDIYGYDRNGYGRDGYNRDGYNRNGYGRDGYNRDGYDRNGYDRNGYDGYGYNRDGYNIYGYDRSGYDRSGYDRSGYDRNGRNRRGQTREEVAQQDAKAARYDAKVARQAARYDANNKFLDNLGMGFGGGWYGSGEDRPGGGGGDIELRLSPYFGLQTGFQIFQDIDNSFSGPIKTQTIIQLPVLAKLHIALNYVPGMYVKPNQGRILPADYGTIGHAYPFFSFSPYAGIGINLFSIDNDNITVQSPSRFSFIAGVEVQFFFIFIVGYQYNRDFSPTTYRFNGESFNYSGERHFVNVGMRFFIPFRKN